MYCPLCQKSSPTTDCRNCRHVVPPHPNGLKAAWRAHPERIGEIVRRDQEFVFLPEKGRLGGSSISSGVFQDKTQALWLGKCHGLLAKGDETKGVLDTEKMEGEAIAEKISNDIYAYFGAEVPEMVLSQHRLVNTGLEEDSSPSNLPLPPRETVHLMSKLEEGAKPYGDLSKEFDCRSPWPSQYLKKPVTEKGLGRILAVAHFINDTDVVGLSGGISYTENIPPTSKPSRLTLAMDLIRMKKTGYGWLISIKKRNSPVSFHFIDCPIAYGKNSCLPSI